ncbi:MAG: ATP-binding cassette domain-containing protein [Acidobacteriota bacterium]|nr:ATP-binding cassette domain-containing protein [Acidobacteriota bacterium]
MSIPQSPALIEMHNVTVVRSGRTVLHALNLHIDEGEHVAILGPNGSGKSTLIKTITRELYPIFDPGTTLRLFGLERWNVSELRTMLGIVSNDIDPFFGRPITGAEAILSGFFSSVGLGAFHKVTGAMQERAAEVMEQLEIPHLANRLVSEMSSGEGRRVMIARALVHAPRALLFDEPSNSLDVTSQRELRQTMSKLARSGLTVLLITHHLPDVVPEIGRVIFMRQGSFAADGAKAELLTSARLSELFSCSVGVSLHDGYYHLTS